MSNKKVLAKANKSQPSTADEFFLAWANHKLGFQEALKAYATQHVEAAIEAIIASTNDGDDWHGVSIDFDAYPLTNIV